MSPTANKLPLVLQNLKKAFGKNIQGPIRQREREYQATTKPVYLTDLVKFLRNRGVEKLSAIFAWEGESELKIIYHFIAKIGAEFKDTKLAIITFVSMEEKKLKSIKAIYPNARIFEEELKESYEISFEEK